MFLWRNPTASEVSSVLEARRTASFTYDTLGMTASGIAPRGYDLDAYGITLGRGEATFERARLACAAFGMYPEGWTRVSALSPVAPGMLFATVARHFGFWSLHPCRVIDVFDTTTETERRWGFYFGTLPGHGERGEERFTISHDLRLDQVRYSVCAMSQPADLLTRLGYPIARALQRRFSREGRAAMLARAQAG